jgi:hypothetical protein
VADSEAANGIRVAPYQQEQSFFALELNRYCALDNKICPKATI